MPGVTPSWNGRSTGRKCFTHRLHGSLVWDSSWDKVGPYLTWPGGSVHEIPTKTPLFLCQFSGRYSSSFRQPFHVFLTSFSFRALLPNLMSLVRCRSIVSLLFIALVHLVVVSVVMFRCSWTSSSLILLSFLSFQIRKAVSDIRILYSRFFPLSILPFVVKLARPQPRMSPRFVGRGVWLFLSRRWFASPQAVDLAVDLQAVRMCSMSSCVSQRGQVPLLSYPGMLFQYSPIL